MTKSYVLLLTILLLAACGRSEPTIGEVDSDLQKMFESGGIYMDHYSGSFVLEVNGIDEYLRRHGSGGWERGLRDERPMDLMVQPESAASLDFMRIKDVFWYYYFLYEKDGNAGEHKWVSVNLYDLYGGDRVKKQNSRDEMIKEILLKRELPKN